MLCLSRSHRLLQALSKVPCQSISPEEEPYRKFVTPYCFRMIQEQLKTSYKVDVLTENMVQSSLGTREVTATDCKCLFFTTMRIPCNHILAFRRFNNLDTFCPEVQPELVNITWTAQYYNSKAHIAPARPRLSISTPRRGSAMTDRDRYKKAGNQFMELQSVMSQCGSN